MKVSCIDDYAEWCEHYKKDVNILYDIFISYLKDDENISRDNFEKYLYSGCSLVKIRNGLYKRLKYV